MAEESCHTIHQLKHKLMGGTYHKTVRIAVSLYCTRIFL